MNSEDKDSVVHATGKTEHSRTHQTVSLKQAAHITTETTQTTKLNMENQTYAQDLLFNDKGERKPLYPKMSANPWAYLLTTQLCLTESKSLKMGGIVQIHSAPKSEMVGILSQRWEEK